MALTSLCRIRVKKVLLDKCVQKIVETHSHFVPGIPFPEKLFMLSRKSNNCSENMASVNLFWRLGGERYDQT